MAKGKQIKERSIKTRDPKKYEYAYLLYMQRVPQKQIAERVGISAQTIVSWVAAGAWDVKRSAKTVSRDQIINKTLQKMNEMLDSGDDFNADEFAKAAAQLKKIQSGYTIDDVADILTKFGDFMIEQCAYDKAITTEFMQLLTKYQDKYLLMKMQ